MNFPVWTLQFKRLQSDCIQIHSGTLGISEVSGKQHCRYYLDGCGTNHCGKVITRVARFALDTVYTPTLPLKLSSQGS